MITDFNPNFYCIFLGKVKQNLQKIDLNKLNLELQKLEKLVNQQNFWQTPQAKEIMQQLGMITKKIDKVKNIKQIIEDSEINLIFFKENSLNQNLYLKELIKLKHQLVQLNKELIIEQFFTDKYDHCSIIFSLHAGQGGIESMDWVAILKRMYLKYFENHNYQINLIDESTGEEAGYKEVVFEVNGYFPYGNLKWEAGTHRLVRLSPFNANNLRQTSFALVEIMPLIDENTSKIELKSQDLEWKFSRSGGPGGQNVNKVSSAVELFYKPLNLTVRCRQSRSQLQNKEQALKILKAKIIFLQEQKNKNNLKNLKGEYKIASFGNQIRNYVIHPYKLVKDTRTKVETSQAEDVLNGHLDIFIESEIKMLN